MSRLNKDPNALRGTHHEGLLELLNEMNGILEAIQRSLDMYLETKRQCFPRFYFLSNDDLLEILGQSKNPEAVSAGNFTRYTDLTVTIPAYCQFKYRIAGIFRGYKCSRFSRIEPVPQKFIPTKIYIFME